MDRKSIYMDLEVVNRMRIAQGLEPLTELPKENEPVLTAEQIEAKRVSDEAAAKATPEAGKETKPVTGAEAADLSDDQLLALLQKRGVTATSFEDLKPKAAAPDPAREAELREANELAFGLTKGLFNKKDYDDYIRESQNPQDFYYAQYHADSKVEDPDMTDAEIHTEFLAKYGLDAEPGTRRHKWGTKEINTISDSLLRQKYEKIFQAKDAFSTHEKDALSSSQNAAKIASAAPQYKTDVESIFVELEKIPFKFSDTETYEVAVMKEHLDEMKAIMMTPEMAKSKILSGYEKTKMKEEVFAAFLYKNFPYLVREISNQHMSKHAAGTRGIPPITGGKKEVEGPVLTEAQQKYRALSEAQKQRETAASAN